MDTASRLFALLRLRTKSGRAQVFLESAAPCFELEIYFAHDPLARPSVVPCAKDVGEAISVVGVAASLPDDARPGDETGRVYDSRICLSFGFILFLQVGLASATGEKKMVLKHLLVLKQL